MGRWVFRHKKVAYWSAAVLTFFVAPSTAALVNQSHNEASTVQISTDASSDSSKAVEVTTPAVVTPSEQPTEEKSAPAVNHSTTVTSVNGNVKVEVDGKPVVDTNSNQSTNSQSQSVNQNSVNVNVTTDGNSNQFTNSFSNVNINSHTNTFVHTTGGQ